MQQVNIYQPILRKQERVFSLKTMLQGSLVVVALLAAIQSYTVYKTKQLRLQQEELQQQRQSSLIRLEELKVKFPPKKKDPTLVVQVEEQQALLRHRQRLIQELRHQNTGADGNPGFSEQLSGLSRQDAAGIWFDEISFRDGKQLTLRGWANSAQEVPQLIQRLTSEASFSGTAISNVTISREEKGDSPIGFVLHSEGSEVTDQ